MENSIINLKDINDAQNAWLELPPNLHRDDLINPWTQFNNWDREHMDLYVGNLLTNPDYLGTTCKIILGINLLPIQAAIFKEFWNRPFPMLICSRGFSKTWMLAVYSILKCILVPHTKIVVAGSAFRQSKFVFDYMNAIWDNAPILKDICTQQSGPKKETDRVSMVFNDSVVTCIPIGPGGEKIRGLRANIVISDEFQSSSPEIYETVLSGFGAVSQNPVENVIKAAKRNRMIKDGTWTSAHEFTYEMRSNNQSIISGTADYSFKHFAQYWRRYKQIVESRGNKEKLEDAFNGEIPVGIKWTDFSIIRIPYELTQEGFMDAKQVGRAKSNINEMIYNMEYSCVFWADSAGFFKRSIIEQCVTSEKNPIRDSWFDPMTRGDPKKKYIMGVDPASESDNLSIIIIELNKDHNRIVYCWTTNRKDFRKKFDLQKEIEHDFYGYVTRKIRNLMRIFNIISIGIDAQGGGISLEEALHDPKKMNKEAGEQMLWPTIDPDKHQMTDRMEGPHILEMVQFADYTWLAEANHGMRADMLDKILLFPRYDLLSIGLAYEQGRIQVWDDINNKYCENELEDCVLEIEELKNELTTIVMSRSSTSQSARDRWDTPETKDPITKKKGRLRKDRYSALLIANAIARKTVRAVSLPKFAMTGGNSRDLVRNNQTGQAMPLYIGGPEWLSKITDQNCYGVRKKDR